jgi:hypothetical protein
LTPATGGRSLEIMQSTPQAVTGQVDTGHLDRCPGCARWFAVRAGDTVQMWRALLPDGQVGCG